MIRIKMSRETGHLPQILQDNALKFALCHTLGPTFQPTYTCELNKGLIFITLSHYGCQSAHDKRLK